jgi:two-component system, sensor histidine kinase and response regulator
VKNTMSALLDERGQIMNEESIVVIDDDHSIRLSCFQALTKVGYEVKTFEDGASGLKGITELKPGLVVVDLKMAGLSGLDVIERVHEIDPDVVIVVITGYATIGTAVDAMKAGAYDFLPKPFKPDELRIIVSRGLERRRLLLDARRAEVERELMKRRFITFVSHQLKTPLVAVHQYLDVMVRTQEANQPMEDQREWLQRCLARTREMREIIDDWLTLAKIEGGGLVHRSERVDVKAIVSAILKSYEEMAAGERVCLSLDMPGLEYGVMGDHSSISVLFDNLVENAIKYNRPGGSVTVRGTMSPDEMMISVVDTGTGVSDDDQPFLFDEFFRGKSRGESGTSGTGLGLPICKRIVAELGGRVEVESTLGVGSVFRVRLPVGAAAEGGASRARK